MSPVQAAGVDRVALVPDVLHVVRLVLAHRTDGHGVDDLALGRGAVGRVDDREKIRTDRVVPDFFSAPWGH